MLDVYIFIFVYAQIQVNYYMITTYKNKMCVVSVVTDRQTHGLTDEHASLVKHAPYFQPFFIYVEILLLQKRDIYHEEQTFKKSAN